MRHLREGVEQKFTKIIHFFCSLLPETSTYSITSQPHEQLISDHNHRGRSKQQVGGKKVYMRAEQSSTSVFTAGLCFLSTSSPSAFGDSFPHFNFFPSLCGPLLLAEASVHLCCIQSAASTSAA